MGNHDTRDAGGRPPPPKGRRPAGPGQQEFGNASARPNGTPQASVVGLPPDLPRGQSLAPGQSATDHISGSLASIPPAQLAEIASQMKVRRRVLLIVVNARSFVLVC